ncbi:imidazole glycerol phosphate synthase, glutamine amidotransferase subunit [Acidihalobacter aeolianus]|uniref:Imidazole glycerol phosphate synthase subunit HisH n=1 Tax=Acidihalobacter aeolianus TaxID=2792603 RepID=A0A1D8KB50_9GAMM|nr:imidazole glycerol phosphate synthase subunit HisH [Acidihalobacter aeolianus]AOV18181.1 imidazole glycerol phosphate synthase, glutamine amidotransferase subunit [Acidihalobacter aeolianus]
MAVLAVIDYGMGNLRSVVNALSRVAPAGDRIVVTSSPQAVLSADRIVFPGQGAARDCMHEIAAHELTEVVKTVAGQRPFLGICMGMQVLLEHSEENGGIQLLGLFPGTVRYFGVSPRDSRTGERLKIPHMGWNQVRQARAHPLWSGIPDLSRFYFVHSYYAAPADPGIVAGTAEYGIDFCAALACDNIFAIQCHPEKSAEAGLRLLHNFARWNGEPQTT